MCLGQLLTEDYYAFNKLAKGLVGTNNIDTNSRLCMSSAGGRATRQTLGADAPPACYEDIDHAILVFIAGSKRAWAHPVLFRRIEAAKARDPALKIVVVDPRRTATADFADLHLAIEPGTGRRAFFMACCICCCGKEWIDADYIAAHTSGFADLKKRVRGIHTRTGRRHLRHPRSRTSWRRRRGGSAKQGPCCRSTARVLNQSSSGTAKKRGR
jgi:assimilatory nitrate reductase catalytic subunit